MMKTTNEQLFSEDFPILETIEYEPILSRYKHVKMGEWAILFVILIAGVIVAHFFLEKMELWVLFVILGILLFLLGYVIAFIYCGFPNRGFAIREKDVHYRKGWLTRSILSVPICRIQHLEVSQGMLGKFWNIAKLEIYTAGDISTDLTISGISFEKAQQIKTHLSKKLIADE